MNTNHGTTSPPLSCSLHDQDFYTWALETACAIRERRFAGIDCEAVAEELEDMGRSEAKALESQLAWISTAGKALMIAVRNTGFFLENTIRFVNPDYTDGEVCLTATCCRRRSIAEQFRDLTERSLLHVRSSLEPKAYDLIEISAP
jgi:uncharacterized protein DUF29